MGFFDKLLPVLGGAGGFLLGGPGGAMAGASLGSALGGAGQAGRDSARARQLQEQQIQAALRSQEMAEGAYTARSPLRDQFMQRMMGFQGQQGNPFSQMFFGGGRPPMPGARGPVGPAMGATAPMPGFGSRGPQMSPVNPQNPLFSQTITPGAEPETFQRLRALLYQEPGG